MSTERDNGRFKPGQSGNPGGRPTGLAARVREATRDGADIVAFYLEAFEGKLVPVTTESSVKEKALAADVREKAASWLADRGFGKATQPLEHSGADGGQLEIRVLTYREEG